MEIGGFKFDANLLFEFLEQPASIVIYKMFAFFGWAILVWGLIYVGVYFYLEYKRGKTVAGWEWVVLAIDIPPSNQQSPKAVEQLFAHIAGALNEPDIAEKYRKGAVQKWFSFEVVSIEGYIQFLVRTERKFRDLVESAIYAQYPEAEIVEVEDYVTDLPTAFPDSEYNMWAADFGLAENSAYPIRTYRDFEHSLSKLDENTLRDPMSAFLESFSRIGAGEQMWFQILVSPISSKWKEKAMDEIKEKIGEKKESKSGIFDTFLGAPIKFLEFAGDQIFTPPESKPSNEPKNKLQQMTPGQVKLVEAMENKISKLGFKTKMRGVYIARKEVFNPERGVNALLGAINQFNVQSANSIVPKSGVGASYYLKDRRSNRKKTLLMTAYKKRKMSMGATPFILNIEELATIWHFPISRVKTPLLQKSEGKKAEPPVSLPTGSLDFLEPKRGHGNISDLDDFTYDSKMKFG